MRHTAHTILPLALILLASLLTACSTTDKLPEGETLYTGIKSVNYVDQGDDYRRGSAKYEGGVIVSIADAVDRVTDILEGKQPQATDTDDEVDPTPQQRDSIKKAQTQEAEVLETVREELDAVFAYPPNNSFFGSSYYRTPLPIGLWAYNAWGDKKKGLGRFLYKTIGSEPVLISTVNPETRVKVAGNVLRNYGYFNNQVDFSLEQPKSGKPKAKINYNVLTGKVWRIDSVEYRGFTGRADSLIQASRSDSYLQRGVPFSAITLSNEQSRIATMLRNEGYYYYQASTATYQADTVATPYKVQLRMQPQATLPPRLMKQWYIGHINFTILWEQGDTIQHELPMLGDIGTYYYSGGSRPPIKVGAVLRNMLHRRGQLYRYRDQQITEQLLSGMGVFSQTNMRYAARDTTAACDTLDLYFSAVMDKRYSTDFEVNVTERNSDRIGPGASLALKKKNAFRGAELLSFQIYGSYEWRTNLEKDQGNDFVNSYEVGTELSLELPRFVFPGMSPRKLRFPASTNFTLSADWLNRSGYYNLFSFGTSLTYTWRKNFTSRHEFTPISLTYDKLLHTTADFDSIMDASPSLAVSMQDQLVPAMQYTYAYTSPRSKRNPITWQLTIKEAGAITSGIFAMTGKKFSEKDKKIFNNPFAQFIKVTSELHKSFKLGTNSSLVTRVMGGIAYSYGNSDVVPYSDQFYVGGANSVRAFTIRGVGPGRFIKRGRKYSYMDQTGDFKLEGNIELRFPLFGSLGGALFVDAGNVWLIRDDDSRPGGTLHLSDLVSDLALGTGAGLRYDLDFIVVRLDMGVALHDPSSTRSGYFDTGSFSDRFAFHFAIGYPF